MLFRFWFGNSIISVVLALTCSGAEVIKLALVFFSFGLRWSAYSNAPRLLYRDLLGLDRDLICSITLPQVFEYEGVEAHEWSMMMSLGKLNKCGPV